MLSIHKLIPQGRGLAAVLLKRAASVELGWDLRQKSRFEAHDSLGRRLGIFLPRGSVVRGGDVLVAEDGSLIRVQAAAQPVLQVRACAEHGSPFDLLRAAYHLGNRHVPLALAPEVLTLEPDHVLADLLRQMHLVVSEAEAPFEPEGGAYAHAPAAGSTAHDHAHTHGAAPVAGHVHGPGCGHDHADPVPAARGRPLGIGVSAAPVPHVHGPGCGHDHAHSNDDAHTDEHGHAHPAGHRHGH